MRQHSSYFLHVVGSSVPYEGAYLTIAHALWQKHSYSWFRAIISPVFFDMVRAGVSWHKIHDTHACAFRQNSPLSRLDLDFFFGDSCEDIVSFTPATKVYFTLADLLETKKFIGAFRSILLLSVLMKNKRIF